MCGMKDRHMRNTLVTLVSMTWRHSSRAKSVTDLRRLMPALLTRICNLPNFSATAFSSRRTCGSSVTSAWKTSASVPSLRTAAAVSFNWSRVREANASLGSGKGSNLVAIAEACAAGQAPAAVALVISDVADAGILARAQERGIRAEFIAPGRFRTKLDEEAARAYIAALQGARVDWIVLARF